MLEIRTYPIELEWKINSNWDERGFCIIIFARILTTREISLSTINKVE